MQTKAHNTSVRIDCDLYTKAKSIASENRYSLNDLVNMALRMAITQWEDSSPGVVPVKKTRGKNKVKTEPVSNNESIVEDCDIDW